MPSYKKLEIFSLTAIALLGFIYFSTLINISFGLENLENVQAFEDDEALIIQKTLVNIKNNDLDPRDFFDYPYLYPSLGILLAKIFKVFNYNVENVRFIGMMFRIISVVASVCCVGLVVLLLQMLGAHRSLAYLGGVTLLTVPPVLYWSHMTHPDILQMAFVLLAFYVVFRKHDFLSAIIGAACLGLSFSTKYAGILVLPISFLPYTLSTLADSSGRSLLRKITTLFFHGCFVCLVFAVVFILINPYAAETPDKLFHALGLMKDVVARGEPKPFNLFMWPAVIIDRGGSYAGFIFGIGCLLFILGLFGAGRKTGIANYFKQKSHINYFCILVYLCFALVLQSLFFNYPAPRYAFYFLPFVIIMSFLGFNMLANQLHRTAQAGLCVLLLAVMFSRTHTAMTRMSFTSQKPKSHIVQLADFVDSRYRRDQHVVYEVGTYVRPHYAKMRDASGITEQTLDNLNPDVLVFKHDMSGRWAWKKKGTNFKDGEIVWTKPGGAKVQVERALLAKNVLERVTNTSSKWLVAYEKHPFVVFEKRNLQRAKMGARDCINSQKS